MNRIMELLERLDALGAAISATGDARALVGLGSAGTELERLDEFSDLDFFVIAKDGRKRALLDDPNWLGTVRPVVFRFRNTSDGWKALYDDGIFCEFAVFELGELERVPHPDGRIVWKDGGFDERVLKSNARSFSENRPAPSAEWLAGEILTNLYVGLLRYRRGERLSAFRFVQVFAVDRYLELTELFRRPTPDAPPDPFVRERRFERRFPGTEARLAGMLRGYSGTAESARSLLLALEEYVPLNDGIRKAILSLM